MRSARVHNEITSVVKRRLEAVAFVFDRTCTGIAVSHLAAFRRIFLKTVSLNKFVSSACRASARVFRGHMRNGSTLSSKIQHDCPS